MHIWAVSFSSCFDDHSLMLFWRSMSRCNTPYVVNCGGQRSSSYKGLVGGSPPWIRPGCCSSVRSVSSSPRLLRGLVGAPCLSRSAVCALVSALPITRSDWHVSLRVLGRLVTHFSGACSARRAPRYGWVVGVVVVREVLSILNQRKYSVFS